MPANKELRLDLSMSPRALDMLKDICGRTGVSKYELPSVLFPEDKGFEVTASVSDEQKVRFSFEVEGRNVTLTGDLLHTNFFCRSVTGESFPGKNFTLHFIQERSGNTAVINDETKRRFDMWYDYIESVRKKAEESSYLFFCRGAEYKNGVIEIQTYDLKADADIKGLTVGFVDEKNQPAWGFGKGEHLENDILTVSLFGDHINIMKELRGGIKLMAYDGAADITCKRMKMAIDRLLSGDAVNKKLPDFIFDPKRANDTIGENVTLLPEDLLSKNMNPEQISAVEGALNASDLYLIQGPPGTGKTTVIAEICYQNAVRGLKTLIVSQSNLAVDNAISRVMNHPDVRVLRKGDVSRVEEEGLPFVEDNVVGTWIKTVAQESENTDRDISAKMQELKSAREKLPDFLAAAENMQELERQDREAESQLYFYRNLLSEIKEMRPKFLELIDLAYTNGDIGYVYKAKELYPADLRIPMEMYNDLEKRFFDVKADMELMLKSRDELAFLDEYTAYYSEQFEYIRGKVSKRMMENTAFEGIFYYADREMAAGLLDEGDRIIDSEPKGLRKLLFGHKWRQVLTIYYRRAENLMISIQQKSIRLTKKLYEIENDENFKDNCQSFRLVLDALGEDLDNNYYRIKSKCEQLYDKCTGIQKELDYSRECFKAMMEDEFYKAAFAKVDPSGISLEDIEYIVNKYYSMRIQRYAKWREILSDWRSRITGSDRKNYASLKKLYIDNANVIGITCIQSGTRDFDENYPSFDTVIIDEASKSTPPDIILPMLKGKKIVLVGDHKQLPPFIDSTAYDEIEETDDKLRELIKVSLFEELYEKSESRMRTMLFRQYRMHRDIAALINQFYIDTDAGRLESPASDFKKHGCEGLGLDKHDHVLWYDMPNKAEYFEERNGSSFTNFSEVRTIKKVLRMLEHNMEQNGTHKSVGVITFYDAQVRLLERELIQSGFYSDLGSMTLRIGSVDRFQGMEEDIIIVSFVRNNESRNIGFARDCRRINVALSRAKDLLIIVGSSGNFTGSQNREAAKMFGNICNIISRLGGVRAPEDIPQAELQSAGHGDIEKSTVHTGSFVETAEICTEELNILDEFILRAAHEFSDGKLTAKGIANVLGLGTVFAENRVRYLKNQGLLENSVNFVKISMQGKSFLVNLLNSDKT